MKILEVLEIDDKTRVRMGVGEALIATLFALETF